MPVSSNVRPQKFTMPSLELKIPPPAVALAFGIFMWLVAMLGPILDLPLNARIAIAVLLVLVGQAISVSGMGAFRRAKTTINPINPTKASTLGLTQKKLYIRQKNVVSHYNWHPLFHKCA